MQTLLSERSADFLVVGGGIAAASLAHQRIAGFGLTAAMLSPARLRQPALG
jgi:hypothetical protein